MQIWVNQNTSEELQATWPPGGQWVPKDPSSRRRYESEFPWVVLDGETHPREWVLDRFPSETAAVSWISQRPDKAKIHRGGYSLVGPADDEP